MKKCWKCGEDLTDNNYVRFEESDEYNSCQVGYDMDNPEDQCRHCGADQKHGI